MENFSFDEYEAPVYCFLNKDGSLNASAGHVSSTLYTHLDLQKKIYDILPEEMKESGAFPRVAHQYTVYRFLEMLIHVQNLYTRILNPAYPELTEGKRRGLKNAGSSLRTQAVCRQQQELFHPLTYEIIEPYITDEDGTAIDAWVQRICNDSIMALNEIVNNFNNTIGMLPSAPAPVDPLDIDDESPF
jgi:hypothetical protein